MHRISADLQLRNDTAFAAGASLDILSGVTVTFHGNVTAAPTAAIFSGPGKVVLARQASDVHPEWFGARADGVTVSTAAFQAAHDACRQGCTVRALAGRYLMDGRRPVRFTTRGMNLVGSGVGATIFGPDANAAEPLFAFGAEQVRISDFQINPAELTPAPKPGAKPSQGWRTEGLRFLPGFGAPAVVENIYIANTGRAIWAQAATDVRFSGLRIVNCSLCVQTGGVPNYHVSQSYFENVSIVPGGQTGIALLIETNTISNYFRKLEIAGGEIGVQVQSTGGRSPLWSPGTRYERGDHVGRVSAADGRAVNMVFRAMNGGASGTDGPLGDQPVAVDGGVTWLRIGQYDTSDTRPGNNWIWHANIDHAEKAAVWLRAATFFEVSNSTMSGVQAGPGLLIETQPNPDGSRPPANRVDGVIANNNLIGGNGTVGVDISSGSNVRLIGNQIYANGHTSPGRYPNVRVGPEARGTFEMQINLCGPGSPSGGIWGNNYIFSSYCLVLEPGALADAVTDHGVRLPGALHVSGNTMLGNSLGAMRDDSAVTLGSGRKLVRGNAGAQDQEASSAGARPRPDRPRQAPAVTSCGERPAVLGRDTGGEITVGRGASGCTLAFSTPFDSQPSCTVTSQAGLRFSYSVTAAALTVTSAAKLAGTKLSFTCVELSSTAVASPPDERTETPRSEERPEARPTPR